MGKTVRFSSPKSTGGNDYITGMVVDSVSVDPVRHEEWGWYYYVSDLIEWDSDKSRSIRISYYYAPPGGAKWIFGGQYSMEDKPCVIRQVLEKTLSKQSWFQ